MMPETSSSASSSPSSCVSFSSFDEPVHAATPPPPNGSPPDTTDGGAVKLLCSYGGRILPRRHDGKLRYVGGHTRVLTVHRPLRFHGLYRKLRELCGWDAVTVRCQLPTEDMDALVTVSGDDDLAGVLDEYDAAAARRQQQQLRIRVFLHHHPPAAAEEANTTRTPPRLPLMASGRPRGPAGQFFLHATRAASPHADAGLRGFRLPAGLVSSVKCAGHLQLDAGRIILVTPPLAPVSPARPQQLLCQKCQ